jgi:hypothetical protein
MTVLGPRSNIANVEAHHDLITRLESLAAEHSRARSAKPPPRGRTEGGQLEAALLQVEQLEVALEHRTVISQAVGRLMERFDIDAEAAFAALSRISQETNRKVYDIARELVATGHAEDL